jgi:hypothetical protein
MLQISKLFPQISQMMTLRPKLGPKQQQQQQQQTPPLLLLRSHRVHPVLT